LEIPFLKCGEGLTGKQIDLGVDKRIPDGEALKHLLNSRNTACSVDKSPEYLNWRYSENPTHLYDFHCFSDADTLKGLLVSKSYPSPSGICRDILELLAADEQTASQMLRWSRWNFIEQEKCNGIYAWCLPHSPFYLSYLANDFTPITPLTYMGAAIFQPRANPLMIANHWNLSMGDSDVF
jgi:hypothetical protein